MRCKPGDLAIVVRPRHINSPDIGKIVKVVQSYDGRAAPFSANPYQLVHANSWIVESVGAPLAVFSLRGEVSGYSDWHVFSDTSLRPIRGDETPTEIIKELSCEHQ